MSCEMCEVKTKKRTEEEKQKLINRINRISGQLNGIKSMILDDRYCEDILIQLCAVEKSVRAISNIILDNHMHSCLIEHIEKGDYSIIDEISNLIRRFQ
jgi:DNA-binding FrmR family transcriptional regulator